MKKQGFKKYVKHGQGGFTLIELLVVVAIIGILAAIAIPRYQDYVARSNATSAYSEAVGFRTAVEAALLDDETIPDGISGYDAAHDNGDGSIEIVSTGTGSAATITITSSKPAGNTGAGNNDATVNLVLQLEDGGWSCNYTSRYDGLQNCTQN